VTRLCASFLSLCLLVVSCTSATPKPLPTPTLNPDPFQTSWLDRAIFQSGLVESERSVLNELPGASVYRIEFNIQPDYFHITGREEVYYTNTESVPLGEVQLRLFPNILGGEMQVTSLQADGEPVAPQSLLENSLMVVPLSKPLQPGQSVELSMDFTVTVPQEVELNYGVLAYYDEVLTLAHAYPMICVYDDEGWNAEIPPQAGDVTYADASFFLVRISAPQELTLVTSGRRVNLDEAGQAQTMIVAGGPARDFFLAASLNFEEVSQNFGEVTIRSYAPGDSLEGAQFALKSATQALEVFNKRYAPYPYTELDLVATPTLALGIEYPGAIALAARIYDLQGEYRGVPTSMLMESVAVHEVGHQWFYNLVGNDQLDDPWLDEALAQFATYQYYADVYGQPAAEGFRASLDDRWRRVEFAKIPIGLPVAEYSGAEYGSIVYGRGPLFFDALRAEIGVSAFDAFLWEYTEALSWEISTPETLQSLAEKHCACDLDDLFAEWVRS